jgi:hypothetical protein
MPGPKPFLVTSVIRDQKIRRESGRTISHAIFSVAGKTDMSELPTACPAITSQSGGQPRCSLGGRDWIWDLQSTPGTQSELHAKQQATNFESLSCSPDQPSDCEH